MATDRRRITLLVISVAALAAAVVIARPYLRSAPGPATEFLMVCVKSGEVFTRTIDQAPMFPAANPRTGEYTLLPCVRDDDGTLRIADGFGGAVTGQLAEVNRVVDKDTLVVRVKP